MTKQKYFKNFWENFWETKKWNIAGISAYESYEVLDCLLVLIRNR